MIYLFKARGTDTGRGRRRAGREGQEGNEGGGKEEEREKGAEMYFQSPFRELWVGEVFGNLSSFVLTWTLFYGLVGG